MKKAIDFIIISLPSSEDRRQSVENQMREFGQEFSYFDAFDVKNLPPETSLVLQKTHQPFSGMTDGQFGCSLSHYYALKRWRDESNSDFVLIFEDDVNLTSSIIQLEKWVDTLRDLTFSVLKLGGREKKNGRWAIVLEKMKSFHIVFPFKASFCTVAYLVRRDAIDDILEHIAVFDAQIDSKLFKQLNSKLIIAEFFPFLFYEKGFKSVIDHELMLDPRAGIPQRRFRWQRDLEVIWHYFRHFGLAGRLIRIR